MIEEYETGPDYTRAIRKDESLRKRLLMLLMKEANRVSRSFVIHFVMITGYDLQWIEEKLEEIRRLIAENEKRREVFRNRRNKALFDIFCIHDQLRYCQDSMERENLIKKLERRKNTLKNMEIMVNKTYAGPSHKQISSVLGIPKGTVDSGLHYMNCKYKSGYSPKK